MASYNRCVLVGNLTRDPELKYLQSGTAVADISLAVNDRRKTKEGEWVDETTFVDITLWSRTAEICNEYLSKGSSVLIEGRLKQETWDDKETGKKRSKLKVIGEKMQMLGKGKQSSSGSDPYSAPDTAPVSAGAGGEDIPF